MDDDLIYDNTRNSWTDTQEQLLKKWYKEATALNWKHSRTAQQCFFINRLVGIPTVIAVALVGTATFGGIDTSSKCNNNLVLQIVIGSVSIITAILMAVQNFLRLGEVGEKHNSASARYKNFCNSIESELVLPREERLNGKLFIKQAQKRFNELFEICPNIPQRVDKAYQKYINNMNALECGNLTDIIINDQKVVKDMMDKSIKKTAAEDDNSSDDTERTESTDKEDTSLQKEVDDEMKRFKAQEDMNNMQRKRSMSTIDKFVNYF